MVTTKPFFSLNLLEILIVGLLVWILGQNIAFQNKMEAKTTEYEDRIIFLEWAFITDPQTPNWQKDQFLNPTRGGGHEHRIEDEIKNPIN